MGYCGKCGARVDAAQQFCHTCGASLVEQRAASTASSMAQSSPKQRALPRHDVATFTPRVAAAPTTALNQPAPDTGGGVAQPRRGRANKKTGLVIWGAVLLIVLLIVAGSHNSDKPSTSSAARGAPNTAPAGNEGASAAIPGDTPTDAPTVTPTTPAFSPAQKTDFRSFVASTEGAVQACDDASSTASTSFKAIQNGGSTLDAYQNADTASAACGTARDSLNTMSVPGSISDGVYHLDDARQDFATSADQRATMWNHVKDALNNPSNLGAQSDVLKTAQQANQLETLGSAWIAEDSISMTVPITDVTPVAPTPIGG